MTEQPFRVFLTRRLPPGAMAYLESQVALTCNPNDRPLSKEELIEGLRDQAGLIATLVDKVDADVIRNAPELKVIANYAVGYNNIDVASARQRGIVVTNTPDILTDATADLTWALILGTRRRLGEAERFLRAGRWSGWAPLQFLGDDLREKVLGTVGLGRIGRAVARRAIGFGMRIFYSSRNPSPDADPAWRHVSLPELLNRSDVVSLHIPLTPETRGLIGTRELAMMKPSAHLINTARGPVVDEAALVDALRRGLIAGAGLDVYEHEPTVHPDLLHYENVLLLPHIGSATRSTREQMGRMAADNLLAVLNGRPAPNQVNF